jgi:D-alanine-D-alanine ligase
MAKTKLKVGILYGGKSVEHEVSLQSAKNVAEALDKSRYEPVMLGISKDGRWKLYPVEHFVDNSDDPAKICLPPGGISVSLSPECRGKLSGRGDLPRLDLVFPILHGPFGEDGTIQGLLKLAGLPFVGSSVAASAAGMDKDMMKRLFRDAGIPIARFITVEKGGTLPAFEEASMEVSADHSAGRPLFVKPANIGSSVGVGKVHNKEEYQAKIAEAFKYDRKVLIEEFIEGREVECAVLGNRNAQASLPGEVITKHDFYSYEAKYIDTAGAELVIPAKLESDAVKRIQYLALRSFKAVCAEGLARVDGFLRSDGSFVVNEINTMPGFTAISMYPKLWGATGISYADLIDRLIQLGIERFQEEAALKTSYLSV